MPKDQNDWIKEDQDGSATIDMLSNVVRLTRRMSGVHPSSLGLHPAVWVYTVTGRYQPSAFVAVVRFMMDLEKSDGWMTFCERRARIEQFLVEYRHFVNQLVREYGARERSVGPLYDLYNLVYQAVGEDLTKEEILSRVIKHDRFERALKAISTEEKKAGPDFTTEAKSAVALRQLLEANAPTCNVCGARVHPERSMQIGHEQDRRSGGLGHSDNGAMNHPLCNSTYKDWKARRSS